MMIDRSRQSMLKRLKTLEAANDAAQDNLRAAEELYREADMAADCAKSEMGDWYQWSSADPASREAALALTDKQLALFRGWGSWDEGRMRYHLESLGWPEKAGFIRMEQQSARMIPQLTVAGRCAHILATRGREWVEQ